MLDQLYQNESFQNYIEQLQNQGYNQTNVEFFQEKNNTNVRVNFMDEKNQTAAINADFFDGKLENIELITEREQQPFFWNLLLIIIIFTFICIISIIFYKKTLKRSRESKNLIDLKKEKSFDYISEANKLLEEAKQLFDNRDYKDAYGKAAQSLRLFLSYYYGLKKEMTNDEIIRYLKNKNISYEKIKECFDLCSLVEFAKYTANEKDFDTIVQTTGRTITRSSIT
jgi:hypothetical protein